MSKKVKLEFTNDELATLEFLMAFAKGHLHWTEKYRRLELKIAEGYVATQPRQAYAERAMNE